MDIDNLLNINSNFENKTILVIGDLILDRYIRGPVSRISPEAPVPVIEVGSETYRLGGAANVATNIRSLGGQAIIVGIVGQDAEGEILTGLLEQSGMNGNGVIVDPERTTTVKTRLIAEHQQVARFDRESTREINSDCVLRLAAITEKQVSSTDAIIISDYDKGVVTARFLAETIKMSSKFRKPILADPKNRRFWDYKELTIIKPNLHTAASAMNKDVRNEEDVEYIGEHLLAKLQCEAVLITRGMHGMSLFEKNNDVKHIPALAREVYDVTGAGDTVSSVLALAMATGAPIEDAAILANIAASIKVGKLGTAAVSREELVNRLKDIGR